MGTLLLRAFDLQETGACLDMVTCFRLVSMGDSTSDEPLHAVRLPSCDLSAEMDDVHRSTVEQQELDVTMISTEMALGAYGLA